MGYRLAANGQVFLFKNISKHPLGVAEQRRMVREGKASLPRDTDSLELAIGRHLVL